MAVGKRRQKTISRNLKGYRKISMENEETVVRSKFLTLRKKLFTSATLTIGAVCFIASVVIFIYVRRGSDSATEVTKPTSTESPSFDSHVSQSLSEEDLRAVQSLRNFSEFYNIELSPLLITRVPGTPGNTLAREHIISRLESLGGWTIETDAFEADTPLGRKPFANVVATLNPSIKRRLVLACHHDSKYFERVEFIGAIDSAVPCAMLLDLAVSLDSQLKGVTQQGVTLQLIFFDGEEAFVQWTAQDSLYGSRHLAEQMSQIPPGGKGKVTDIERMDMMVLLDLIGTPGTVFRNFYANTSSWFQHLYGIELRLRRAGVVTGRYYYFDPTLRAGLGGIEDDHIPFIQRGVRIIHLISVPFPSVWHQESDNTDALEEQSMRELNAIFRVFLMEYLHLSMNSTN